MALPRKTRIICPSPWSHHRGGWPYCNSALFRHIHLENGIAFYTNTILATLEQSPILEPWLAFLHITRFDQLEERIRSDNWQQSLPHCRGFFTLSRHVAEYTEKITGWEACPVTYPAAPCDIPFTLDSYMNNPDKRIVHVGHWLRRPEDIYCLRTTLKKTILNCTNRSYDATKADIVSYLPEPEYDKLLSRNIMFLSLLDAGANTSVVEAIVRNQPVLVNRLPGTEEYLGKDYPFFYSTLEEASHKLDQEDLIEAAHLYLRNMNKDRFRVEHFVNSIAASNVYQQLA